MKIVQVQNQKDKNGSEHEENSMARGPENLLKNMSIVWYLVILCVLSCDPATCVTATPFPVSTMKLKILDQTKKKSATYTAQQNDTAPWNG